MSIYINKKQLSAILIMMGFTYKLIQTPIPRSIYGYAKNNISINMNDFAGLIIRASGFPPRVFIDDNTKGYNKVLILQYINSITL